ncbi:MAG: hypothetical protein L6R19_27295 [Alphaproteobacteria bacterium]|nr:hypothetical protein [Alphaproteobacteria bacterium]
MRGPRIAAPLCPALAAVAPDATAAEAKQGSRTITLPYNLARSQEPADEAFRHDRAVAHLHQNMRVRYLQDNEGAEGIVFVSYTNGKSHAFDAADFKRRVVFTDDQKPFRPGDAGRRTVERALRGKVAWSGFYRTR